VIDQCLENLRVAKACPTISSSGAPRAERLVKRANKAHDTTLASQTGAQFDLHGWHSSIGPRGGAFVGSDQIAEIAPGVKEALVGGPSWCATFKIPCYPNRWVQFTTGTINAAYPHIEAPESRLDELGSFALRVNRRPTLTPGEPL
jgi:hypothetical protein